MDGLSGEPRALLFRTDVAEANDVLGGPRIISSGSAIH